MITAGVGASGPDYASFAKLYLDSRNASDAGKAKVTKTYAPELYSGLQSRCGYAGSQEGALDYFLKLPTEQQAVFDRQVYFVELMASGREFNDPTSPRYQSYARGKQAIAALLPSQDSAGNVIDYAGDIRSYSGQTAIGTSNGRPRIVATGTGRNFDSGIRTDFGGDIQILTLVGRNLLGVSGSIQAGRLAGILSQGNGNIDVYSAQSVLLGWSRVFTTYGGDILMWSAQGGINAGRGAKSTVVFAPVRRA